MLNDIWLIFVLLKLSSIKEEILSLSFIFIESKDIFILSNSSLWLTSKSFALPVVPELITICHGEFELNLSLKGDSAYKYGYIYLSSMFMAESKAISLCKQNPNIKLLDVGVGNNQFIIDWANNLKNQGKILTKECEMITNMANNSIKYYQKNYS